MKSKIKISLQNKVEMLLNHLPHKKELTQLSYDELNRHIVLGSFKSFFEMNSRYPGSLTIVFSDLDNSFISLMSDQRKMFGESKKLRHTLDLFFSRKSIDLGLAKNATVSLLEILHRPIPTAANILVEWTGDVYVVLSAEHNSYEKGELVHAEEKSLLSANKQRCTFQLSDEIVAYPSLEPCTERLAKKSCVDLLIENNIKRVVISSWDSNPVQMFVSISRLRKAGIDIVFMSELENIAVRQNFHQPLGKFFQLQNPFGGDGLKYRIERCVADAKYFWFRKRAEMP